MPVTQRKTTSSKREGSGSPKTGTSKSRRTAKPAGTPSPTRPITPGSGHLKIAEGILRGAQKVAGDRGVSLDVGEFPEITLLDTEGNPSDPERPVRLVAHAVARSADRFKFLRKISRKETVITPE